MQRAILIVIFVITGWTLVDGWRMKTEDDAGRVACRTTWSDSGYLSKWSEHRRECMVQARDGFWIPAPKAGASGMRP